MSQVTRFGADPTLAQEVATKAYVDSQGGNTFARIVKLTETQIVNNSTVFVNDDTLFVALEANRVYSMLLLLAYRSQATPDFKITYSVPAGATGGFGTIQSNFQQVEFGTKNIVNSTNNADMFHGDIGLVEMGGTAGNLQLQWAQNTANVSDSRVRIGATLIVYEQQ